MTRRFHNFCYLTIACLVLALSASASFGVISSAAPARQIQLGVRVTF